MKLSRQDIINNHINLSESTFNERLDLTNYDPNKPTILLIDDFNTIISLFERLVNRLKLEEHFNVVYSTTNKCGLRILNELYNNEDFTVDIVISDITFGNPVPVGNNVNYNLSGIMLVGIMKTIFPDLLYRFITGHIVSIKASPELFDEYATYCDGDLLDYIEYKDKPLTSNYKLIRDILVGTEYEEYCKKV